MALIALYITAMDDFLMPEELDNADDDENDMMKIAEGMETTTIVDAGMKTAAESEEEYLEQMKELVEQYKQIKNETKEIDELARQLAIGVHLQTEMDKCASERRDFPIQIGLELRFLASGSSLLLVKLQNTSDLVLHKWHLAVNMTPLSSAPSNGCGKHVPD
ncbi:unnamed protein product [Toxocara canis]|uniref:ING domain-containing protein n=1 Tax=Toxocara canis TaxID=6265 RepID=A0A183TZ50_TOXCA|nr:unnamed protein product [Toxocara canis]